MNKVLLTLAAAALTMSASAQVKHETRVVSVSPIAVQTNGVKKVAKIASNQRWAGAYTSDNLAEYGLGIPDYAGNNKAAVYLTPEMMQGYVGKKIVGMRVGLCAALSDSRFFILGATGKADNPSIGDELWAQDVASANVGWNEVSLSTPIEITSGQGYFTGFDYVQKNTKSGQYYTEDCYPLSCVEEGSYTDHPLFMYANIPASKGGSGEAWYRFNSQGTALSVQLLVEGDFADYDVTPSDFADFTGAINATSNVTIGIANNSKEAVRNLSYVVTVDGVAQAERTTTLASTVGVGSTGTFEATVDCGSDVKTSNVSVEVTKVNGHDNLASKKVAEGKLVVLSKALKRGIVVEEFTGTGCGWCPRGLVGMENLAKAYPDNFVGIGIHQYNNTDPMYTGNYANLGFRGAPACMINRNGATPDPYYGTGESILDDFAAALKELPLMGVSVNGVWNADSTTVTVNASIESLVSGQYNIAYVLVADDLTGTGSSWKQSNYYVQYNSTQLPEDLAQFGKGGSKGQNPFSWEFDDVLIGSSYTGTTNQASPVTLTENETTNTTFEVAMPTKAALKKALKTSGYKVAVIAMVLDKTTGRVMNAAKSYDIKSVNAVQGVKTSDNAVEVARYNAAGQRIEAPVKGLNIIKLSDGRTQKVIVK